MPKAARAADSWPPIAYEQRQWRRTGAEHGASQRQLRRHQGPYTAAAPASIAAEDVVMSSGVATLVEDATTQIVRLDASIGESMGDELAPLAAVLLRTESASSSQIENVTAGARSLALQEIGQPAGRNAELVVHNVRAMQAALDHSDDITTDSLLAMHEALLGDHEPAVAGRWRAAQVWIGGSGLGPHQAEFVPPHHSRVRKAMQDLITFVARDDIPALVQASIAHAQFETIHPFSDGNGRVGRALLHAVLRQKGVIRTLAVPISAGLLTDTRAYFDALTSYRMGELAPLLTRVAQAALEGERNGRQLIDDLTTLGRDWRSRLRARRDAAVWRLIGVVLRQPVVDTGFVADQLGVSTVAAQNAIDQLVAIGALTPATARSRHRVWQATLVIEALDDFAARPDDGGEGCVLPQWSPPPPPNRSARLGGSPAWEPVEVEELPRADHQSRQGERGHPGPAEHSLLPPRSARQVASTWPPLQQQSYVQPVPRASASRRQTTPGPIGPPDLHWTGFIPALVPTRIKP